MATRVGWGKMRLAAFDGPSPKTPYRRKKFLRKPSYSQFCPKFRCHGNGGRSGKKCDWQHSMAHPRKPPYRRKNIAKMSYSSRVIATCPKFRCHGNGGQSGKKCDWQHSMAHPRKPPYRRKNIAKMSYISRVIANFGPNFVAMATGVSQG